jgi:protein ImuB
VALALGTVSSTEVPDTVWLDITGAAHLAGGEAELLQELSLRVRALGHTVRAAVASGPRIAQAFSRWAPSRSGTDANWVVSQDETTARLSDLPVNALPIDAERVSWLVRLGIHTIGELRGLPRAAAASRLGDQASQVLDMAEGIDDEPLVPYEPVLVPTEHVGWEDPVTGSEPLLFVLRGLTSRLSARLEGRGEAAQVLELSIEHDRSIATLCGVSAETTLRFELSSPLWREEELRRIVSTRVQRLELGAPSVGVSLRALSIARALKLQLDLSRSALGSQSAKGPDALPIVLGELAADIGKEHFGILDVVSSHLPERRSRLVAVPEAELLATLGASRKKKAPVKARPERRGAPNRLFSRAIPLDAALRVGVSLSIDHRLYTIEKIAFEHRLESVEWWTSHPASRDYLRLWLKSADSGLEALVYVNRETGSRFLQALCD